MPLDPNIRLGIDIQPPEISLDAIEKIGDMADGSSLFNILNMEEESQPEQPPAEFYSNLAEQIEPTNLNKLCYELMDSIKDDLEARSEWDRTIKIAMKYLGFKIEESRKVPFVEACAAFDTTLAMALIRFVAVAKAELFPIGGPAHCKILGEETEEVEDRGDRVKQFMNHFLTDIDEEYYPDSDIMLMYIGFTGCGFRKVYTDPITNRPVPRSVNPQDFIVDPNTKSLLTSNRMTQVLSLDRKEVILREQSGEFLASKLSAIVNEDMEGQSSIINMQINKMEGVNLDATENKSLFKFYECHVDLTDDDLEGIDNFQSYNSVYEDNMNGVDNSTHNELPKPYIVSICVDTKKIVSIKRNWKEGDVTYKKLKYFISYKYLPGFGIYGLGLAHIMGSNAIVLTSQTRQMIDSATLSAFPGGLKVSGMRLEDNDKAIGPGEFRTVETGGLPIQQCIMTMPYKDPSPVMMQLRDDLRNQTAALGTTADSAIPEMGSNAPVGTTLALLEENGRIQSSILRSLHFSLSQELKLLFELFAESMPDEPYPFSIPGKSVHIMRQDFSDNIHIVPVSDPNIMTSTHRLIRAEALYKTAMQMPQFYDMREVNRIYLHAMNITDIDKILIKPDEAIPLDPITENMNALTGKPLKVGEWQDHPAHNIVHMATLQQNPDNQALAAHIAEHNAQHYLLDMQMKMNMQLPPLEQLANNPELQNTIAIMAAQAVQTMQEQQQQQQPLDPNAVMMAEIEQRDRSDNLKYRASELDAETKAFVAQLKFESDKEKNKTNKEIAVEKSDTDLTLANMKLNHPGEYQ